MKHEEDDIQKAICQYLDIRKICYWAVPNGGSRSNIVHDGLYYGLEVKKPSTSTPKGYLSKNQKEMISKIEKAGGEVKVVYSVADVVECTMTWGLLRV